MEYSIEKTSPTSVSLSVTCSADEVKKAFERAAKHIGKGMNLPGFRVGKIPVNVIKSRFASRVAADATEMLADNTMMDILKKEGIRPLSPSQYRGQPAEDGREFSFSTTSPVFTCLRTYSTFPVASMNTFGSSFRLRFGKASTYLSPLLFPNANHIWDLSTTSSVNEGTHSPNGHLPRFV